MLFINTSNKIDETSKETLLLNSKYTILNNKSFENSLGSFKDNQYQNIVYTYSNFSQEIKIFFTITNMEK